MRYPHATEMSVSRPSISDTTPSLFAPVPGPLTDIESFTAHDLTRYMNGGPLTLEFDSSVFNNPEALSKIAMLVKYYIDRGGHQLQLNSINRDRLREAQAHPEQYPNLIVRVWGWSGHFIQLDKSYQDQIIERTSSSI